MTRSDEPSPAWRPIGPSDCALAVALPWTRAEYDRQYQDTVRYDFVRHNGGGNPTLFWERVYASHLALMERTCAKFEAEGGIVVRRATLTHMRRLYGFARAVTLIAHFQVPDPEGRREGMIEMSDGLQTLSAFVAAIPPSFDGVIDLSVCESVFAFEPAKQQAPSSLVIVNKLPVIIGDRFLRFDLLMETLAASPMPFVRAVQAVQAKRRIS